MMIPVSKATDSVEPEIVGILATLDNLPCWYIETYQVYISPADSQCRSDTKQMLSLILGFGDCIGEYALLPVLGFQKYSC